MKRGNPRKQDPQPTVEEIYQAFWKDIIEKPYCCGCKIWIEWKEVTIIIGTDTVPTRYYCPVCRNIVFVDFNKEQVKKELHDYTMVIQNVPKVYQHITRNQISKPHTLAEVVIAAHDDSHTRDNEDIKRRLLERLYKEFARKEQIQRILDEEF